MMCLIERSKLENVADALWFNMFSLSECQCAAPCRDLPTFVCEVFEMVSAYGTVGLSLGIPTVPISRLPCHFALTD